MSLKATIFKARIELADMDRNLYGDYQVTIARHPSETDERMMVRLLIFALNVPDTDEHGALEFAKDLWEPDEPGLWQKDLIGHLENWIEVGQPDDKRLLKADARSNRVTVYSFASSTSTWWSKMGGSLSRTKNLTIWQIPSEQSQQLANLAERGMDLHVSVQEGTAWVSHGERSVEITPVQLFRSLQAH